MKLKITFSLFLFLGLLLNLQAENDKYRLILLDDPATTITVAWNQISGDNPIVYYGTEDHGTNYTMYSLTKSVDRSTNFRGMHNQFARLTGLMPNTSYYFVIKDSEGTSQRFWFKTAPDDNSRLSFIAGGDSRNNREPRQYANTLVSKLKPHAVYFGGDMTRSDNSSQWKDWFDDWQLTTSADGRMIPIVPTRGNHENATTVYKLFDTPNESSYYAITWGDNLLRAYTLNTEISVLGNQLTWLRNDLASSRDLIWKMAQYHKPMRPHTSGKSEGNAEYGAWAQLFYDEQVKLVVDCDSHMAKTTWPVKPSSEPGNDEGFVMDQLNGTVYTGEGCWGAPLRPNDDNKSWTRSSGSFNQVKLIFVDQEKIELRTLIVNENASNVIETSNDDPFTLPSNLDIFSPETGEVVVISNNSFDNPCDITGTSCDDGDDATVYDEENGFCHCQGVLSAELLELAIPVSASSDDAEEELTSGEMDLSSSDLELIYDGGNQLVGIRFNNVAIPQDATIHRAYIQFQTDEDDHENDPTNLLIHGELSVSSNTFTSNAFDISSRTRTNNSVSWNEINLWETVGETGLNQRTPYLTNIVEEVISQQGWVSGNSITFIISGEGERVAESFDGSSAPVLKIFYREPCQDVGTVCNDGNPQTILDIQDGNCNCVGIPNSGTLVYQVNDGDNDAEERINNNGSMYLTSSDLELNFDGSREQNVGIRFTDILIPQGATILDAHIQFTVDESDYEPTSLEIKGEKIGNSPIFEDIDYNISSRTKTSALVNWLNIPAWTNVGDATEDQRTPDLKTIVQEIVNQSDWQPLNAMTFIIVGNGQRTAESFNGSQSKAPQLIINYSLENNCPAYGTPCDDGNENTINDEEDGYCNCQGVPNDVVEDSNLVQNSNDDAEEKISTGEIDLTSSDLELIYDRGEQLVGIRFNGVQIPEGSTLHRAYIQFETDETDSEEDPTNLIIHGELSPSSSTFTSENGNISSRQTTNTFVSWNEIALWDQTHEVGLDQRTPYLTGIVEEIISQEDWQTGNAITFLISGQGKRVAESFDGSASPILKLFYQTPCNPQGTVCNDGDETTYNDVEDGNCNCAGIPEIGTLTYQINAGDNDAEEAEEGGAMYLDSSDLELVYDSYQGQNNQTVGLRFTDIILPQGAQITNAYIQFAADEVDTQETNLKIHGEKTGNSEIFTEIMFNISSRTTTNSMVNWDNVPAWNIVGEASNAQRTPDLKDIVQEIINQQAWQSLNAMTFIITGNGSRAAESFNGSSSKAARLVIEYDLSSTECLPPSGVVITRITDNLAEFTSVDDVMAHYQGTANLAGRPLRPYPMYGMNDIMVGHVQNVVPVFEYDLWFRTICENEEYSDWAGPFYLPRYNDNRLTIYPNPTKGITKIGNVGKSIKSIEIYDVNGMFLMNAKPNPSNEFNMSLLLPGKYNIRITDVEGEVTLKQVIKH